MPRSGFRDLSLPSAVYTVSSEYAFCILGTLAREERKVVRTEDIASGLGIPADYAAKVLQQLRRAGFLESQRGRGGGFRLARDPREITLLEVVRAIEGEPAERRRCLLAQEPCHDDVGCLLHRYRKELARTRERILGGFTVADLGRSMAGTSEEGKS